MSSNLFRFERGGRGGEGKREGARGAAFHHVHTKHCSSKYRGRAGVSCKRNESLSWGRVLIANKGSRGTDMAKRPSPFTHYHSTLHIGWEGYVDIDARRGGKDIQAMHA
jgi:hypothetical protein